MTNRLIFACLVLLFACTEASAAECMQDQGGNVVTAGEDSARGIRTGSVYCAPAGGGAVPDQYGTVKCGTGYCTRDEWGEVFCSRTRGGAAMVDTWGKPKCLGGCEAARPERCEAPR